MLRPFRAGDGAFEKGLKGSDIPARAEGPGKIPAKRNISPEGAQHKLVGKASGAAVPGDSVLIGGAIRQDNCFFAQFALPCTATVHCYGRGASGSVRDSL